MMTVEARERAIAKLDEQRTAMLAEAAAKDRDAEAATDVGAVLAASNAADALRQQAAKLDPIRARWVTDLEAARGERETARLREEAQQLKREAEAAGRRLAKDYERLAAPLAKLIGDVADLGRRVDALNTKLRAAGQPPIPRPEAFRASAPRHHPEVSHTVRQWVGPDGTACTFTKPDPKRPGELIPANPGPWREIEIKVVDVPARDEPARMPPPLADSVTLPGLREGDAPLWPRPVLPR